MILIFIRSLFNKADNLIMMVGLKPAQTELFKQAGNWVINEFYITKAEVFQKCEAYLVTAKNDTSVASSPEGGVHKKTRYK